MEGPGDIEGTKGCIVNKGSREANGTGRVGRYAEVRIINVGYCSSSKLRCSNGMAREWAA
jgi:hypothetical protein